MADEPPYIDAIRRITGKRSLPEINCERVILQQWKAGWSKDPDSLPRHLRFEETLNFAPELEPLKVHGWTAHFYRYLRLLIPAAVPTPELLRMIWAIEQTRLIESRKVVNFIGSKNSGKTQFFALAAIGLTTIDPEYSRCYVSGPYKGSADAIVWGRIGTRWGQMKAAGRGVDFLALCKEENGGDKKVVWPGSDEAGFIELITLDKVGKLQGAKSLDPERGWIVIICDEVAQFPTRALIDAIENAKGNENLLVITGCNFKHIEGLDGDLCRPEGREFAELDTERDQDWLSAYTSHTWRFDGHRASNIIAQRVIYPFLLRESTRAESESDHGLTGPKYLEQIRSFPNSSMSDFFILTRERVRAGGGFDEVEWKGETPKRVAFCDPGFGGDPCKIGAFQYGRTFVPTTDGGEIVQTIFMPIAPFQTIKLSVGLLADEVWIRRLTRVLNGTMIMRPGELVTFENQIAVQAAEFCFDHSVPYDCFGFDGSMRSAIVQEFIAVMGGKVSPVDPVGSATNRPLPFQQITSDKDVKLANDEFFNFVSEEYFNLASLVQARQMRGADMIPAAIAQICRRPWKWTGQRKQIQPKAEYKTDNQGRSPDDADVLVGGFEMALRKGFITVHSRRPAAAEQALDPLQILRDLQKGGKIKTFGIKRLHANA